MNACSGGWFLRLPTTGFLPQQVDRREKDHAVLQEESQVVRSAGGLLPPSPGLVRSCAARRLSFRLAAASRGGNRWGAAACGHPAPAVCTEAAEPCVVPFESASVQATLFEFPEETSPEAAKVKRSVHRASPPMIEPVLPGLDFERDVPESLPTLPAVD